VARELGETSLMFMVHPTLTEENMHYVVGQVKEVMAHAKAPVCVPRTGRQRR